MMVGKLVSQAIMFAECVWYCLDTTYEWYMTKIRSAWYISKVVCIRMMVAKLVSQIIAIKVSLIFTSQIIIVSLYQIMSKCIAME